MFIDNPKTLLVYGDSNVRGMKPLGGRYIWGKRWTGQLQKQLGSGYRIIEEGLNGRTSGFDDPLLKGRNGFLSLPVVLQSHLPIDLLILTMGNNDCKPHLNQSVAEILNARKHLIQLAQDFNLPNIVCLYGPTLSTSNFPAIAPNAEEAIVKSIELEHLMPPLCESLKCAYLNAENYCQSSQKDGLHLEEDAHRSLAQAVFNYIQQSKI